MGTANSFLWVRNIFVSLFYIIRMYLEFPSPGRYGPLVDLLVVILKFFKRESFLMSTRTV